jgi:3-oxoacyl-[acyl-carrier protein] reductase
MSGASRTAVVTGAAGGIGAAVVQRFAEAGHTVLALDRSLEGLERLVKSVSTSGPSIESAAVDVTDPTGVGAVVDAFVERHGRADILVNAAGFPDDHLITDMDDAAWRAVLDVCLFGTFVLCRAVAAHMIAAEGGRIISISSRAYLGNPGQVNYSAAKAGIHGLSSALAKELGRHGITVNVVAPGIIDTPLVRSHPKYEMIRDRAVAANSIRRMGTPEDVADAVAWLASEGASFVTGEVIHVSGGRFS